MAWRSKPGTDVQQNYLYVSVSLVAFSVCFSFYGNGQHFIESAVLTTALAGIVWLELSILFT